VGQVLSQQKVLDLPIVGNNVLDLITGDGPAWRTSCRPIRRVPPTLSVARAPHSRAFSAQKHCDRQRRIQVQDNRYPNGIYSATTINPDLVGEIRLILAPVDAEMGRGNGAIQYSTALRHKQVLGQRRLEFSQYGPGFQHMDE
jgi:hypothetical protein